MKRYKRHKDYGFFDQDIRMSRLSKLGDPLEKLNKGAQKDTDARWTKKGNVHYFGYKNHVKQHAKSKLITTYTVTDASVHDSQIIEDLLYLKRRRRRVLCRQCLQWRRAEKDHR